MLCQDKEQIQTVAHNHLGCLRIDAYASLVAALVRLIDQEDVALIPKGGIHAQLKPLGLAARAGAGTKVGIVLIGFLYNADQSTYNPITGGFMMT